MPLVCDLRENGDPLLTEHSRWIPDQVGNDRTNKKISVFDFLYLIFLVTSCLRGYASIHYPYQGSPSTARTPLKYPAPCLLF
jgi:hypothetical protein